MKLHLNQAYFKETIAAAAEYLKVSASHIEKDYWVTKMLKEISCSPYAQQAFFKGGTSLSKAYGIIDRFSEDLDMLTYTGDLNASKSKEKALNKKVCNEIIKHNADFYKSELSKTGGNFRKLCFDYKTIFKDEGLKENLEVEIKACDFADKELIYYPTETKTISSIAGDYLSLIGRDDLVKEFELEPFDVECINPRKTVCIKYPAWSSSLTERIR